MREKVPWYRDLLIGLSVRLFRYCLSSQRRCLKRVVKNPSEAFCGVQTWVLPVSLSLICALFAQDGVCYKGHTALMLSGA
jgi:hypothetical protein